MYANLSRCSRVLSSNYAEGGRGRMEFEFVMGEETAAVRFLKGFIKIMSVEVCMWKIILFFSHLYVSNNTRFSLTTY